MDWSPNLVHHLQRERYASVQAELWKFGYSFVHLASTRYMAEMALGDLNRLIFGQVSHSNPATLYHASGHFARFLVCTFQGASTAHVPVMFVDAEERYYADKRALSESRYIPTDHVVVPGVAKVQMSHGTHTCPSCNTTGAYRGFNSIECTNEKCRHYRVPTAVVTPSTKKVDEHEWVGLPIVDLSVPFQCNKCGRVQRITIMSSLLGTKEPATSGCPGK